MGSEERVTFVLKSEISPVDKFLESLSPRERTQVIREAISHYLVCGKMSVEPGLEQNLVTKYSQKGKTPVLTGRPPVPRKAPPKEVSVEPSGKVPSPTSNLFKDWDD